MGQELTVFLHSDPATRWYPVSSSNEHALISVPNTVMTLPLGVTAGIFKAASPGVTHLSSARSPCPSGGSAGCAPGNSWTAAVSVIP